MTGATAKGEVTEAATRAATRPMSHAADARADDTEEDGEVVVPPATAGRPNATGAGTDGANTAAGHPTTHRKAVTTGGAAQREEVAPLSSAAVSIIDEEVRLIVALFQVLQFVRAAPLDHPPGASTGEQAAPTRPATVRTAACRQCTASPTTGSSMPRTRPTPKKHTKRARAACGHRNTTRTSSERQPRKRTTEPSEHKRTTR